MRNASLEAADSGPKPSRIFWFENLELCIAGAIGVILAFLTLVEGRNLRNSGETVGGPVLMVLGLALGAIAFGLLTKALRQARLRFTVDYPRPLNGNSSQGKTALVANIREGVSEVAPEQQSVDFLLTLFEAMDRAPIQVQFLSQAYLRNFALIIGIGVAYLLCLFLTPDTATRNLLSVIYFIVLVACAFRVRAEMDALSQKMIYSTVLAGIGIPVLSQFAPLGIARERLDSTLGHSGVPTGLMVLVFLLVGGLFLVAVLQNARNVTTGRPAREHRSLQTMTHPGELHSEVKRQIERLGDEFDRGRGYIDIPPNLSGGTQGTFDGQILFESAPVLSNEALPGDFAALLQADRFRWLVPLTILAGLCWIAFFTGAWVSSGQFAAGETRISTFAWLVALLSMSVFAQRSAHLLWSRTEFTSWLVYAKLSGHYQASKMSVRAGMDGGIETERNVLNTDNLQIEIYVSRVHSIAFGLGGQRSPTSMIGDHAKAAQIVEALLAFSGRQSSITAPQTGADIDNAARIGAANRAIRGEPPVGQAKLPSEGDETGRLPS